MEKITIKEKLAREKSIEPIIVDKDNGTQSFEDSKTEKVNAPVQTEGAAQMDNSDPSGVKVDYITTPVVIREKRIVDESISKSGYKDLLARYKEQNPKKYEAKKAELERKAKEADSKKAASTVKESEKKDSKESEEKDSEEN